MSNYSNPLVVLAHGQKCKRKGKRPSMAFGKIRNPRKAFEFLKTFGLEVGIVSELLTSGKEITSYRFLAQEREASKWDHWSRYIEVRRSKDNEGFQTIMELFGYKCEGGLNDISNWGMQAYYRLPKLTVCLGCRAVIDSFGCEADDTMCPTCEAPTKGNNGEIWKLNGVPANIRTFLPDCVEVLFFKPKYFGR